MVCYDHIEWQKGQHNRTITIKKIFSEHLKLRAKRKLCHYPFDKYLKFPISTERIPVIQIVSGALQKKDVCLVKYSRYWLKWGGVLNVDVWALITARVEQKLV